MKISRNKLVVGVLCTGLAVALFAGCTSRDTATSAASSLGGVDEAAAGGVTYAAASAASSAAMSSAAAGSTAGAAPASGGSSGSSNGGGRTPAQQVAIAPVNRSVIKTASVALQVEVPSTGQGTAADNDAVADRIGEVAVKVNALVGSQGFVQSSTAKGSTAAIILRVPVNTYDTVMKQVSGLGRVTSSQETAQDVTGQAADLDARVKTMRDSVNSVRALLAQATKISDVIAIESELESRQADLESLEQQLAALSGQVALSTVTVTLEGVVTGVKPVVVAPAAPADTGFIAGLKGGWHALKDFLTGVAVFLGAILPFLPVVAVVLLAVLIWRRRWLHRQPTPVPAASSGPAE